MNTIRRPQVCNELHALTLTGHCLIMLLAPFVGCSRSTNGDVKVQQDIFIEFRSKAGNTIVAPSKWTSEEDGNGWYLGSPDQRALISIHTFPKAMGKSLEHVQNAIVEGMTKRGDIEVLPSHWEKIELGGGPGWRRELVPMSKEAERQWRVFAVERGELFHALVVHASPLVMDANGDFYESIVATFQGVDRMQ